MTRPPAVSPRFVGEVEVPGAVPRLEIPGWRDRYGVVAGNTARRAPDGSEFDLGLWTERPVGEVMGRWRELRRMEPGVSAVVMAHQVHGAEVAWHRSAAGWTILEGVDGHATDQPGLLLAVTVADCVPVFLVDPVHRAVALLHAGWRGTAAGIVGTGLRLLEARAGSRVENIVMHSGPAICGPCYEVGDEVLAACGKGVDAGGRGHLDLRELLAHQAAELGVENISTSPFCSCHERDRFFSHRGSAGRDGRMVAFLGLLPG